MYIYILMTIYIYTYIDRQIDRQITQKNAQQLTHFRSSRTEVLLGKGILKMCCKYTGEHPCESVISIKQLCNFIEIEHQHRCSPVNLLHISRTLLPKNISGRLLLTLCLLNLFRMGIFGAAHGWRGEKDPSSLKFVTHFLQ